ncbi:hypothetical protein [uncultured Sporomusa sp.]|uniref:hypothetical protein n=1 Tax=uncultured Sporomusa sp. TaxID=307249 RepID=UPI002590A37F|nr:hypothetical protein [uncultured Sporomusa sp.]
MTKQWQFWKKKKLPDYRELQAFLNSLGHIGAIATNFLHLRNPYTIAWWSAAFPGFGYISLGNYIIGFLLFFWEVIINTKAGVNAAILYSFIGDFAKTKEVLNTKWRKQNIRPLLL